jgi:hypothetical protein
MAQKINTPWLPVFGNGAPGAGVPTTAEYFDTSTVPFTPYVYHGGQWNITGGNVGGTNASALQGTPVSATPPSNGQVLKVVGGVWTPQAGGGGGAAPVIIQMGVKATPIGIVALPTNVTPGNLLVGMITGASAGTAVGTGWTLASPQAAGGTVVFRIAQVGDGNTFAPGNSTGSTGNCCVYEISGATLGRFTFNNITVSQNPLFINALSVKGSGAIIIGCCSALTANLPVSGTNCTLDTGVTGAQSPQGFHLLTPAQGFNMIDLNYAGNQQGNVLACELA